MAKPSWNGRHTVEPAGLPEKNRHNMEVLVVTLTEPKESEVEPHGNQIKQKIKDDKSIQK